MALANRSFTRVPLANGLGPLAVRPVRLVLARAEPPTGAKVTREYREGDSEVTEPGASTSIRKQSDGLYVDANTPMPPRKKDNMSKEMKARLRAEYTGFGGAENKDSSPAALPFSPRLPIIVAAASVELREAAAEASTAAATAAPLPVSLEADAAGAAQAGAFTARPDGATDTAAEASTSGSAPAVAAATTRAPAGSKWTIDENENLKSTPEMRAWTWVSIAMIAATFEQATRQISGPDDWVVFGGAVMLAYILADLGTGIYHWGVDNYGDGNTPVFGRQIAAFQGHHQRPWTITQREFANNLHQVFGPASYPAAALLTLSPLMPLGWNAWSSSFLFLVCMSQQFHAWSHMKKSELHPAVVALQDAGVLIGRRAHGAHHRAPFEGNYSIVSGWWNPLLDSSGFFRKLEKVIHESTGVAPRCWSETLEDWRELERPADKAAA